MRELPELKEGQTFADVAASVTEHFTTPPKPYTEDTLLSAMERAGPRICRRTPSARAGNPGHPRRYFGKAGADGLCPEKGQAAHSHQGRHQSGRGTAGGFDLSPLTAEWECCLTEIAKGQSDPDEFMAGIEAMTRELMKDLFLHQ